MIFNRKLSYIDLTASLIIGLLFFSGCIEKEKFDTPETVVMDTEFPLDAAGEDYFLDRQYGSSCFANPDCLKQPVTLDIATEFSFLRGQLILKGPQLVRQEANSSWLINEHIKVLGAEKLLQTLTSSSESSIHIFDSQPSSYEFLNLSNVHDASSQIQAQKPRVLFQSRLGLPAHEFGDAGFCNLLEAEAFMAKSKSPWLPHLSTYLPDSEKFGYNPETKSYIAETVVICGGLNLLNTHLTIEAKNVIFYNSHITVSADQELPTGLKIVTENLGYFGANVIETNIINDITGQKGSAVPTVELSVSSQIGRIESDSSPNNRFNDHFLSLFLSTATEKETFQEAL